MALKDNTESKRSKSKNQVFLEEPCSTPTIFFFWKLRAALVTKVDYSPLLFGLPLLEAESKGERGKVMSDMFFFWGGGIYRMFFCIFKGLVELLWYFDGFYKVFMLLLFALPQNAIFFFGCGKSQKFGSRYGAHSLPLFKKNVKEITGS